MKVKRRNIRKVLKGKKPARRIRQKVSAGTTLTEQFQNPSRVAHTVIKKLRSRKISSQTSRVRRSNTGKVVKKVRQNGLWSRITGIRSPAEELASLAASDEIRDAAETLASEHLECLASRESLGAISLPAFRAEKCRNKALEELINVVNVKHPNLNSEETMKLANEVYSETMKRILGARKNDVTQWIRSLVEQYVDPQTRNITAAISGDIYHNRGLQDAVEKLFIWDKNLAAGFRHNINEYIKEEFEQARNRRNASLSPEQTEADRQANMSLYEKEKEERAKAQMEKETQMKMKAMEDAAAKAEKDLYDFINKYHLRDSSIGDLPDSVAREGARANAAWLFRPDLYKKFMVFATPEEKKQKFEEALKHVSYPLENAVKNAFEAWLKFSREHHVTMVSQVLKIPPASNLIEEENRYKSLLASAQKQVKEELEPLEKELNRYTFVFPQKIKNAFSANYFSFDGKIEALKNLLEEAKGEEIRQRNQRDEETLRRMGWSKEPRRS